MSYHKEKLESLLLRFASEFLHEHFPISDVMITPTKIETMKNFKKALIFVTIYPENKKSETIKKINRFSYSFRAEMMNKIKKKFIPFFEFRVDTGERNRQKIERIFDSIEKESGKK